jgi:preprotein translocase subunit SecF
MYIIKHRAFFFWLTGIILVAAIASIAVCGLPLSIDFTGGSLVEVEYAGARPDIKQLKADVDALKLGEVSLRESGANGVTLRARTLTPEEHQALLKVLGGTATSSMPHIHLTVDKNGVGHIDPADLAAAQASSSASGMTESRFTSIGPSLGSELMRKSEWALGAVMLAIVLYIAWAFRRVSRPVPSWGYGVAVVAMLVIDIIVPTGFYAALAHYTGAQVDVLFVVALLALMGYVVNDVIIVFDRVREHLANNEKQHVDQPFEEAVGQAIDETIGRSINTSLTVVLALLALIFIGAEATRDFALVLLVGVVIGTFSSICRSAPLLIPLARWLGYKGK